MKGLLSLLLFLCVTPCAAQQSILRAFEESGGTVSTGNAGSISALSNGDIVVINERWTNFSQKGIQCFVLDRQTLEVKKTTAFFNHNTLTAVQTHVKGDTVYAAARLSSGSDYSILLMAFTADLKLLFSKELKSSSTWLLYSFLPHPGGGFVLYGILDAGTSANRFYARVDESGEIIWTRSMPGSQFTWGQACVLPDGSIIGTGVYNTASGMKPVFIQLDQDGNLLRQASYSGFDYVIGAGISQGRPCFGRYRPAEELHYAMLFKPDGTYSNVSQGVKLSEPHFFHVRPNGNMVYGSPHLPNFEEAFLQLSELAPDGKLISSMRIDNVFGLAPTGALRDACKYSVASDAQGNLLVLGVANRSGFFVLRLVGDSLSYECATKDFSAEPSPVPEADTYTSAVGHFTGQTTPYSLTEEPPGTFHTFCTKCDLAELILPEDTTVCNNGESVTVDAGNKGATFLWSDGSTKQTLTVNQSGSYQVRIQTRCIVVYDTVNIRIFRKPEIRINADKLQPLPGETVHLTVIPDTFNTLRWFAGDTLYGTGSGIHWTPDRNGKYRFRVQAYDTSICEASDSILIHVSLIDYYIPNAFTPNGNGLNESWGPVGSGISQMHIQIHNRWGECVFDAENQNWDGRFRGMAAPDGLYLYRILITDDDGLLHQHKGYLWLLN